MGIDPETDELAFYPLLYWPLSDISGSLSPNATRKLAGYMRTGGTIVFDTADGTRRSRSLARLGACSSISPPLVPVAEIMSCDARITPVDGLARTARRVARSGWNDRRARERRRQFGHRRIRPTGRAPGPSTIPSARCFPWSRAANGSASTPTASASIS